MSRKQTPWGKTQTVDEIADGIVHYTTASHGGIWLSKKRRDEMPAALQNADCYAGNQWYEEDVDWCIPTLAFPAEFATHYGAEQFQRYYKSAVKTLINYHPDVYEDHFGRVIQPGESSTRDENQFLAEHANNLIVVSAIQCDADPDVVGEYVDCIATLGGRRELINRQEHRFLIPSQLYHNQHRFGYVIDENAIPIPADRDFREYPLTSKELK